MASQEQWAPQRRNARGYPLPVLLRFHWPENLLVVLLLTGLLSGLVSPWLAPIAASLCLAVPLSALSGMPVARCLPRGLRMQTPTSLREPAIVLRARRKRQKIARLLDMPTLSDDHPPARGFQPLI